jgi:adenylate kinase
VKIILLGPPGAGKGTQAARIATTLGVPRVSSGDLFRDHQERDTELGRLARSYMERGVLVPDDVTIKMVMEWINDNQDAGGVLLDGFPRTLPQAEALERELGDEGGIDVALNIGVSQEELMRRLDGRLICRTCQAPYHQESSPPAQPGKCDRCGGELYQRDDDKPEAVEKRIQVYLEQTAPLVEYYRAAGALKEVDGERPIQEVTSSLLAALT